MLLLLALKATFDFCDGVVFEKEEREGEVPDRVGAFLRNITSYITCSTFSSVTTARFTTPLWS